MICMDKHKVIKCDLMDKCKRCSSYPCELISSKSKQISDKLSMTADQIHN